ncbi:L,D-transpeptidase family protein [Clostridium sp. P21]|uniref:L,D-transpeptidase family protein n=1 Tax=Clostridium muellerianum TaxID=2716538 RepID=A0A7Y0EDS6_9CLOT|nr:cell wall-binding repeat-containing protein [Clostridium muellerianum]NMM61646.1 L,D-transpeptidase family protein [Clostridium muellerianum]
MVNCKLMLKNFCKVMIVTLISINTTSKVYAQGNYQRYGGTDRYETSMKISQKFDTKSGYAIIASGENFPDALCACPLSKKYDAPIILTTENKLDSKAAEELKRSGIKNVFIIGNSISKDVETSINTMGITCERIGGKDRYETAMMVANYVGVKDRIVVVSGDNYPDALSIAPIAASIDVPIILVEKNSVPDVVKNSLKDKQVNNTYVIGSEGAISNSTKDEFKNAERISGTDRYSTNLAVISRFRDTLDLSTVYLASGSNFPDSLSGSALAQKTKSPLILVSEDINENEKNDIKQIIASTKNVSLFGLEGAVSLKALYLIGLEKEPPKPAQQGVQPPAWTSSFNIMNAGESERVYIKSSPSSSASNIGSTYGSLPEVKILGSSGGYYYVEVLDYDTLNYIKGYVSMSMVNTVTPSGPYNILVDKSRQRVYVFNGETVVKEFICSTGKDETPTPSGRFLVGAKGPSFAASDTTECYYWTRLDNNYLFHSAIYTLSGYAVQSEYNKLGSKASHGCIRLKIEDAKWIQDNVPYRTLVTIKD